MTIRTETRNAIAIVRPTTLVAASSGVLLATFVAGFGAAADRLQLTPAQLALMVGALLGGALVTTTQPHLSQGGTTLSCGVGSLVICVVQFVPALDWLAAFCFVIGTAMAEVYARLRYEARRATRGSMPRAAVLGLLAGAAAIVVASLLGGETAGGVWASAAPVVTLLGAVAIAILAAASPRLPELPRSVRRHTVRPPWPVIATLLAVLLFVPARHRVPARRTSPPRVTRDQS